jgi:hypothetical protein
VSLFEADCNLTGVSGTSASDVIAIGDGTIPTSSGWQLETLAYRYNGSAWSQLTVPASIPYSAMEHIQAFSATDAWAVGTAPDATDTGSVVAAVNWNGSTWTQVATPLDTTANLTVNAISGTLPATSGSSARPRRAGTPAGPERRCSCTTTGRRGRR